MNWGTIVQELLSDTSRPSSDSDRVKLAICDAIDQHAHETYFFQEQRFSITLAASTKAYGESTAGFPKGAVTFLDDHLFLTPEGKTADAMVPIDRVSQGEIEDRRSCGGLQESQPFLWSVWARQIELYPTPEAEHTLEGRVYAHPGAPIKLYTGGAWKFYKPFTTSFVVGNEMTDAYPSSPDTNSWFVQGEGYQLIRWYAAYLLWVVWQTGSSAAGEANAALQRYAEVKATLEDKTARLRAPIDIEPFESY